jgi:hypothetical protein
VAACSDGEPDRQQLGTITVLGVKSGRERIAAGPIDSSGLVQLGLVPAREGHVFVAVRFKLSPPAPLPELPTELRELVLRVETADGPSDRALADELEGLRLKHSATIAERAAVFSRLVPELEGPPGVLLSALGEPGSNAEHVAANEDLYPSKLDVHGAWFEVPETLEVAQISIQGYAPSRIEIPRVK